MNRDAVYMERCLELAAKGYGLVSPNPMVGCVIVRDDRIVAEGFHRKIGEAHAEIEALRKAGGSARGATLYVNLEPCVHFGRTPPCVDAIIKAGIRRVVAAMKDPNPVVGGKGIQKLRKAGVKVDVSVLRASAEQINEKFLFFMRSRFPFIGVKVAQTLDGKIADDQGRSRWITSREARRESHRLRVGYDAVLVGAKTVKADDPQLTVRHVQGRNPIRIVLDGNLSVPTHRRIFETTRASTILVTTLSSFRENSNVVNRLEKQGVRILALESEDGINPQKVVKALRSLGISSVLVEGGGETIGSFVRAKIVNKFHCFISPKLFGGGKEAFPIRPSYPLHHAVRLKRVSLRGVGDDFLLEGYPDYR